MCSTNHGSSAAIDKQILIQKCNSTLLRIQKSRQKIKDKYIKEKTAAINRRRARFGFVARILGFNQVTEEEVRKYYDSGNASLAESISSDYFLADIRYGASETTAIQLKKLAEATSGDTVMVSASDYNCLW